MERCAMCGSTRWCGRDCANAPKQVELVSAKATPKRRGQEAAVARVNEAAKPARGPDVCPTCGHRLQAMTNAERQRRYRERKNG